MGDGRDIVIGIDQGTTNTKAVAIDRQGRVLGQAERPIASASPRLGWVEQDPNAMLANGVACVGEVLAGLGRGPGSVAGLGIANQTETLVVWDSRTGEPVLPAIVWKCRRGDAELASLRRGETVALLRRKTGLDLDPTFTAAKLRWIAAHRPEIAARLATGDCLFGTVDVWLIWKLTGGATYATEPGNASRTMLLDIAKATWDPDLAALFDLKLARLPELRPSAGAFGETARAFFGAAVPITAAMGDQQAALFGHGCFEPLQLKVTYGTGAFLWVNAGSDPAIEATDGLIRTIAWSLDRPTYALEGFVMYAGAILDWLATRLGIEGGGAAVVREARQAGLSDGVVLVPAFQGLAAPWWRPEVRAGLIGMTEATTRAHLCHAGLEALCYQIRAVLEGVRRSTGRPIGTVRIDGGPTRSDYLMQMQANMLQQTLAASAFDSMTPFGAALMAGLGAGVWRDLGELRSLVTPSREIAPDPGEAARWDRGYADWRAAAEALLGLYDRRRTAP
ncbi:MAG TPA: FGGY family carbohydrate kinase [Hypericibacter adhaerens]|uniref:Glycerol kinase 2 n=1 Tax=Hypericibacter adhaerens TaxID=2602016 RepID=A0A5J6N2Y7_9PROT|nr:FGGY family carbohydrate kinase [Hypericibacter adhaerens]QEX22950.1 glycerol kinase 2 [Hypericibacter adhaerens]HWA43557.1 FGGY family carbohydrate kinase [Hypericibacter adhaerens]